MIAELIKQLQADIEEFQQSNEKALADIEDVKKTAQTIDKVCKGAMEGKL